MQHFKNKNLRTENNFNNNNIHLTSSIQVMIKTVCTEVKYSGQLQTKLNTVKEISTVLPKYHRTCLFYLIPFLAGGKTMVQKHSCFFFSFVHITYSGRFEITHYQIEIMNYSRLKCASPALNNSGPQTGAQHEYCIWTLASRRNTNLTLLHDFSRIFRCNVSTPSSSRGV